MVEDRTILDRARYTPTPTPMPPEGYCPNGPDCPECAAKPPMMYPQPAGPVWFVTIMLDETVHAIPGGFTRMLHKFASAPDSATAVAFAQAWCALKGIRFRSATATPSVAPGPFTFPESFLDAQLALSEKTRAENPGGPDSADQAFLMQV